MQRSRADNFGGQSDMASREAPVCDASTYEKSIKGTYVIRYHSGRPTSFFHGYPKSHAVLDKISISLNSQDLSSEMLIQAPRDTNEYTPREPMSFGSKGSNAA